MRTLRIIRSLGGCLAPCLVALTLVAVLPAAAQFGGGAGMQQPNFRGVFNPVVGSGATYQVTTNSTKNEIEITVVGKEDVDGKAAYWMEMGFNAPNVGQMYMKNLMATDSTDGKTTVISRMIMQLPGQPPMEMPAQMLTMMRTAPTSADVRDQAEHVGTEDVTTPAGTFSCDHYRAKDGKWDVWISSKVGPWGLVKSSSEGTEMVLERVITDAKDHITGTPQQFNPAAFGMPGRRGQ